MNNNSIEKENNLLPYKLEKQTSKKLEKRSMKKNLAFNNAT